MNETGDGSCPAEMRRGVKDSTPIPRKIAVAVKLAEPVCSSAAFLQTLPLVAGAHTHKLKQCTRNRRSNTSRLRESQRATRHVIWTEILAVHHTTGVLNGLKHDKRTVGEHVGEHVADSTPMNPRDSPRWRMVSYYSRQHSQRKYALRILTAEVGSARTRGVTAGDGDMVARRQRLVDAGWRRIAETDERLSVTH
ncbi:hypothetical protein B0H19DRAFT_1241799 [Mycena capillaripes]|nr:hypothetical protein B0H19DRAFT_1241799 [Mycena capillaripes]